MYAKNAAAYSQAQSLYNEANDAVISSEESYRKAIKNESLATNEVFEDAGKARIATEKKQADKYAEASKETADRQAKEAQEQADKILAVWDGYDKKISLREMTEAEKWEKVGDWFAANPNWDRDNEDLLKQYDKYLTYIEKGEEAERKAREKAQKEKTEQAEKDAKELEQKQAAAVKRARTKIDNYKEDYDWDNETYAKALKEHLRINNKYYEAHAEEREDLQRKITNLERQYTKDLQNLRIEEQKKLVDEDLHRIEFEKNLYDWTEEEYNKALKEHLENFASYYDMFEDEKQKITEKILLSDKAVAQAQQKQAEEYFDNWTKGYEKLVDEAEKAYNELEKDRESFQNNLLRSVELYGETTKKVWDQATRTYTDQKVMDVSAKNLREQLTELQAFDRTMEKLKSKNVGDDLLAEIWGMDPEKAAEFASALNSLSTDELKAYEKTYEGIKNKTSEMSNKYYQQRTEDFKETYIAPITKYVQEHSEELEANMENIGKDTIDGWITGMESKAGEAEGALGDFMNDAVATAKKALGIESPSKEFYAIGEYTIQGFLDGIMSKVTDFANIFTTLGQTAGESFVNAFKSTWDSFVSLITTSGGFAVPVSMTTSAFGTPAVVGSEVVYSNSTYTGLTKQDVTDAIKAAVPDGDIILTVDGTQFGRVSRDSLNLLAQQQGRLGLMV